MIWRIYATSLFYLLQITFVVKADTNSILEVFNIKHTECLTDTKKIASHLRIREKCVVKFTQFLNCFPQTARQTTVYEPCSPLFFYESGMVPARCNENGTWETIKTLEHCKVLPPHLLAEKRDEFLLKHNISTEKKLRGEKIRTAHKLRAERIKEVLQCIDLSLCLASLILLFCFIPLDNARVMLHRNLISSFLLSDILKILLWTKYNKIDYTAECNIIFVAQNFFFLAQVCWMFNEGFFQFRQFFFVFVQKPYIWRYFMFGWAFPAMVTFGIYLPLMLKFPVTSRNEDIKMCWILFKQYEINQVIYVPVVLLMTANMIMMTYLMWMIWSKLKDSNNNELHKARKAARGFFILIVLLGGGYAFTLYGPDDCFEFKYFEAVVAETQGIFVCLAHVIFSREVNEAIRGKYRLFKLEIWASTDSNLRRPSIAERLSNGSRTNHSSSNLMIPSYANTAKGSGISEEDVFAFNQSNALNQKHGDELFIAVDKAFQEMKRRKPEAN